MAKEILKDLKEKGKVERGALGVTVSKLSNTDKKAFKVENGALVQQAHEDMAAYKAGIRAYDVIVKINGEKVKDRDDLIRKISSLRAGDKVKVTVVRDKKEKTFSVTLDSREDFNNDNFSSDSPKEKGKPTSLTEKLGFSITNLTDRIRYQLRIPENIDGVIVDSVDPMSTAYDLGLRKAAVITEINRIKIKSVKEFVKIVNPLKKGDIVILKVMEGGSFRIVTLEVKD
jgi:serine protease Do